MISEPGQTAWTLAQGLGYANTLPHEKIPYFLNRVAAGFPSPADDFLEHQLSLDELCIRRPAATFFLRVSGHSMVGAGIHDGDILVVDRSVSATSGCVAIVALEGQLAVKRLLREQVAGRKPPGFRWILQAEHPDYPPIVLSPDQEAYIWGVVTYAIHAVV